MKNPNVMLPGLEAIKRNKGRNETAAEKTLQTLTGQGLITAEDAALQTLLLSSAFDVDNVKDDDAASGRASLLKTYLAVLKTVQDLAQSRKATTAIENTPDAAVIEVIAQ